MDAILYWNEVATEADHTTHTTLPPNEIGVQGPAGSSRRWRSCTWPCTTRIFSINGKPHGTYLASLPAPKPGADTDSAIAGASHATLSALYPTQQGHLGLG